MLISELPEQYKSLAIKRRKEYYEKNRSNVTTKSYSDKLDTAFSHMLTPEWNIDSAFWYKCDLAKSEDELPPFPYESAYEFEEQIEPFNFC